MKYILKDVHNLTESCKFPNSILQDLITSKRLARVYEDLRQVSKKINNNNYYCRNLLSCDACHICEKFNEQNELSGLKIEEKTIK